MLVPQTYPLYIATLNVDIGAIESGRIIAWEQTDAPEAVLVPIFIWFGPEQQTMATVRCDPRLVSFVGYTLEDVEHRAKMHRIVTEPDEVTATEGSNIDIDDDLPDDDVDWDEVVREQEVLNEKACEPPVPRKPKDGDGEDDPDNETRTVERDSGRPFQDLVDPDS
jgi:hypothetical protein